MNWKAIFPFIVTFMFGVLAVNIFVNKSPQNIQPVSKITYVNEGSGISSDPGTGYSGSCHRLRGSAFSDVDYPSKASQSKAVPLKILSKPKALYTEQARQNEIQGTVRLRVTFLADNTIGNISVVSGLDDGLNEQAITAAQKIKFESQIVNGVPQSVTKQVEYNFTLY